ncbi:MAG: DNA cytosine methyltransferase, partial [Betaproteobacteria bacterium]|nr:DNA cytosine methyltransferase [Betaproteobacteria bacterium]
NVKSPGQGKFTVQDPRMPTRENRQNGMYRVAQWDAAALAITGASHVAGCAQSVADPRPPSGPMFAKYKVTRCDQNAGTVIGGDDQGAYAVADPRRAGEGFGKYAVTGFDDHTGTVISGSTTGQGAFAVADPRPGMRKEKGDAFLSGGHYGVIPWKESSGAVSAAASQDNGRWSVADPRLPEANEKVSAIIQSLDGTWHRPFTTLELAALQSLLDPEDYLELEGLSDSAWRERIGNAVPPEAAAAIASVMGTTLLLAWSGETFVLSAMPIWVQPMSIALSVDMPANIRPSERDSL